MWSDSDDELIQSAVETEKKYVQKQSSQNTNFINTAGENNSMNYDGEQTVHDELQELVTVSEKYDLVKQDSKLANCDMANEEKANENERERNAQYHFQKENSEKEAPIQEPNEIAQKMIAITTENTNGNTVDIESTKHRHHRNIRRKTQAQCNQTYTSSSDENIPLSVYLQKEKMKGLGSDYSDDDTTFIPTLRDLNTSDSDCYSDDSITTGKELQYKKRPKKPLSEQRKVKRLEKKKHSTRIQEDIISEDSVSNADIQRVKEISSIQALVNHAVVKANEGRLDQVLYSNKLQRCAVPRHGNCFFDAALLSGNIKGTSLELRHTLCKHLVEYKEEYIGFITSTHSLEDKQTTALRYLQEVENLQKEGYWSTRVADFLPLALANHMKRTVKIYTSKPEQPLIVVQPSRVLSPDLGELCLAYISVPQVLEHYDGCEPVPVSDSNVSNVINAEKPGTSKSMDDDDKLIATPVTLQSLQDSATPRKQAHFITPVKKRLSRKRKATPEHWKRNIRKKLRLCGQEYTSATGKKVPEKVMKQSNCTKCRYKCNTKFTEEERQKIFNSFWAMESYERQKDFICARVLEKKTKTFLDENEQKVPKKKKVARTYSFEIGEEVLHVCKRFFLATLSVGEAYVLHALANKVMGHFEGSENRGKFPSANKISSEMIDRVKNHIRSFPTVESHYTRKDSNRQYLEPILTLPKMYDLYREKCEEEQKPFVKLSMYRHIFNEDFNLSFHVPKKDQCNLCSKYYTAEQDGVLTDKMKEEFNLHQKRKIMAREEKEKDKQLAKTNSAVHTCTFDLQSVLYTPCSLVSVMYYMRKLCCYNLSVYSLGSGEGSCYVWSEVNGKRGSSEIATCIHLYLKSLPSTIEHVILYSDACTGQNRNQIMATSLMLAVNEIDHIQIIDHKFLESGHTHMECDSMHSAIEFAKKKTQINVPSQWDTVITMARRNKPYRVVSLRYSDFIDFHKVRSKNLRVGTTDSGVKVNWTLMKWMRFTSTDPGACYFKYDMKDKDFERILLTHLQNTSEEISFPTKYI